MKNLCLVFCLLATAVAQAQDYSEYNNSIKLGGGYTHDFPGLNGYTVFAEASRYMSDKLKGAVGLRSSNLQGYPRTQQVQEYTKSTGIDFTLYFVPVTNDVHELRIGAGYSFSFYKIRRSYPVIADHGGSAITNWPVQDSKGRSSGLNVVGEYEYFIPGTNFSAGLRASVFKAYDKVGFVGVFGAMTF
jgi:hypothetical protein